MSASGQAFKIWEIPELLRDGDADEESASEVPEVVLAERYEAGHAVGYDKGVAETRAHYEALLAEKELNLDTAVETASRVTSIIDEGTIAEMAQLSAAIAAQVIRAELALQPELIVGLIEDVVEQLPHQQSVVTVFLHPGDFRTITNLQARRHEPLFESCRFMEDETVERGNCRAVTDDSLVNADLNDRVGRIVDSSLRGILS